MDDPTTGRRLIAMVTGATPGLGKTSLCRRLVSHLNASSRPAVLFREEDIVERSEFADVIAVWRSGDRVPTELLLHAVEHYLKSSEADQAEVFVQDMLFPYLPSLLAWGYSDHDIQRFFAEFAERCAGIELVQIHLTGDPRSALQRAGRREGDGWLDQLMVRVSGYADQQAITDLDGLTRYFSAASQRSERLLSATPWPVIYLDSELGEDEVAARAIGWFSSR